MKRTDKEARAGSASSRQRLQARYLVPPLGRGRNLGHISRPGSQLVRVSRPKFQAQLVDRKRASPYPLVETRRAGELFLKTEFLTHCLQWFRGRLCSAVAPEKRPKRIKRGARGFISLAPLRNMTIRTCFPCYCIIMCIKK